MYKIKDGFLPLDETLAINRAGRRKAFRNPKNSIQDKTNSFSTLTKRQYAGVELEVTPPGSRRTAWVAAGVSPVETVLAVMTGVSTLATVGSFFYARSSAKMKKVQICTHKFPASRRICRQPIGLSEIKIIEGKEYLASYCSAGHQNLVRVIEAMESKKASHSSKSVEENI